MRRGDEQVFSRDGRERPELWTHRCKPTERRYHTSGGLVGKSRGVTSRTCSTRVQIVADSGLVFKVSSASLKEASQETRGLLCSYLSFQNKQHRLAVRASEPPESFSLVEAIQKRKKKILQRLRLELKSDRCFCIKEDTSLEAEGQSVHAPMPLLVRDHVQVFETFNRSRPDPEHPIETILNLFKSAEKTQALHFLLDEADSQVAAWFSDSVWASIHLFIGLKSSSAVLNRLANRSKEFHLKLSNYCTLHLSRLVVEHNPGKLIQSLLQSDEHFRAVCLGFFRSHLEVCMKNFTALFLLTVAIKYSRSDSEYSFVKHKLVTDWKHHLQSKYFKRIIVSYIEYCSPDELVEMHRLLKLTSQFSAYLSDKFRTFILLMFLKREFEEVIECFCEQIRANFRQLFKARYFKFLLLKCANINSSAVVSKIFAALRQISPDKLREFSQKKSLVIFYSYILVRLCQPGELAAALTFLRASFLDSLSADQLSILADQ